MSDTTVNNARRGRHASLDDQLREFGFEAEDGWLQHVREAEAGEAIGEIAGYCILDVCGRGGQGTVYRARREDGRVVALKRIHGGAGASASARRRLAVELQAAAALSHPGIVRARPVHSSNELLIEMDWIEGLAVTTWADGTDGGRVDVGRIVGAFVSICDAIAHAHKHGILHRDLKPSNILVDCDGRPFILDFGLARSFSDLGGPRTHVTLSEPVLGTPAYASPEQIAGHEEVIDARTDIYSLGVLMYEVFVGQGPYSPALSLGKLLSAVETLEPRRPRALNKSVPRDVEAVILKAIAKRPKQRYQTVDQLKADLERCQSDLPIAAPKPGFLYDLKAIARRYPTRAALVGAATVLLMVTTIFVLIYAVRLRQARENTLRAHRAAERVSHFLSNLLLESGGNAGSEADVVAQLDAAGGWLDSEFADDQWARVRADVAFGRMYAKLGAWQKANRHLTAALATYRVLGPSDRRSVAETLRMLGLARAHLGGPQALELQREALAMMKRLEAPDYRPLANYYASLGETLLLVQGAAGKKDADRNFEQALDILGGKDPAFPNWTASILLQQGKALAQVGDMNTAVAVLRRAFEWFDKGGTASQHPSRSECQSLIETLLAEPAVPDRGRRPQEPVRAADP